MPQQTSVGYDGTIQACWCLVLFSVSWKHNAQRWCKKKRKRKDSRIKKKRKQQTKLKSDKKEKRKLKCALCTFCFQQYYWYHITFTKQC